MSACCDPAAYERLFDGREAERRLRRYRDRGVEGIVSSLLAFLIEQGVAGKSVLEVGGGVGHLQVELLKAGASHSVNVELSHGYEEQARDLLESEGLSGRVERRLGDFVGQGDEIAGADIVLLDKVICCYPWMEAMMDAATRKTKESLAIILPRDRLLTRALIGLENIRHRLRRPGFRAYVHDVDQVAARAAAAGLTPRYLDRRMVWQAMVYTRS